MKGLQSTRRIETAATSAAANTVRHGQQLFSRGQRVFHTTVRWCGFWAAIVLPLLYLPVLTVEIGPAPSLVGFGLLGCHLLALLVGHNHNQETA